MIVDGVNKHNMKMTKATLQSIVIDRPGPTVKSQQSIVIDRPGPTVKSQHMCMDKGYNYELIEDYGYTIHIPLRGEEHRISRYGATHWIVETTNPRQ